MAIFHFTAKAISRSKGQSAVHTAAYNAREQLQDERNDKLTKDYSYKGAAEFSGIFAPKDAPAWAADREQLWNKAEAAETRKDGQPARNVEFAFPYELNEEQRRHLVTDFAREAFARKGMVADVSIHRPHEDQDERNYHAHCLLTMRRIEGDEFAKTKAREWNSKAELEGWREKWAHMGGRALERAGFPEEAERFKHGHETLVKQREAALARGDHAFAAQCDREPGIHKGAAVSAMERRDDPRLADNDRYAAAREITERNALRAEIKATEQALGTARAEQAQEAAREAKPSAAPTLAADSQNRASGADLRVVGKDERTPEDRTKSPPASDPIPAERQPPAKVAQQRQDKVNHPTLATEARAAVAGVSQGIGQATRAAGELAAPAQSIASGVTGILSSLADSLLGSRTDEPKPQGIDAIHANRRALRAMENLHEKIKRNEGQYTPSDLEHLTDTHLKNLTTRGDAYVREVVERIERDRLEERKRDRERER